MKRILQIIFIFLCIGCKTSSNTSDTNSSIASLNTSRYSFKYPKNWEISQVHGYRKDNSVAIFGFKEEPSQKAWCTLLLDIESTENELMEVLDNLIQKNYRLKNATILDVKKTSDFVELNYRYMQNDESFRAISRYYKRDNSISVLNFGSKEENFEMFEAYKKLFFKTFVLK
ncbi:hypothetical protein [Polaribacter sp. Hel_I_88]|uniref:hypothetical protein n=1 Tax=Polaribacter sp. Hel_I_88 TaxID=1250006 RepID=UPI00047B9001|nr:hypothetical protein [Polaribacter sp. Hel_I_88]